MKKRFLTKMLALMIAAVFLFGVCAPTVSAATRNHGGHTYDTNKNTLNYVSLGDSMTNGYGLEGYHGHSGVEDYGDDSYANWFAEWLAEEYGVEVDHSRLAMSGMRAEDLRWILEFDHTDAEAVAVTDMNAWNAEAWNAKFATGDYWTYKELCRNYFATAAYAIENGGYTLEDEQNDRRITTGEAAIIAEHYQSAVKNADIISIGIGNGNFGAFMFMGILEAIGFKGDPDNVMMYSIDRAISTLDPELQRNILALIDEIYAAMEEYLGEAIDSYDDTVSTIEALANIMIYSAVSFAINYVGAVEAILRLNPDAEIILIGLMNALSDNADIEGITVGDLIKLVYTPLNAFIAAMPTYIQNSEDSSYAEARFYYAEADYISCNVDTYGDDFYIKDPDGNYVLNANGKKIANEGSVIRDRFVSDLVGTAENSGMMWQMLSYTELIAGEKCVPITLHEILAYEAMSDVEKARYADTDIAKAMSCAAYLAIEKAVIAAGKSAPIKVEALLNIMSELNVFEDGVMDDFASGVSANSKAEERAAAAISAMNGNMSLTADTLKRLYAIEEELFEALNGNESVNSILNLMARCIIGSGLGGHPSSAGHYSLFEAVRDSYDDGYTVQDKINDLINGAIRFDYNPYIKDPHYFAIGQFAQAEETYAELFAEKINAEKFSAFDNSGYRASELLAILDESYESDAYGKAQIKALREKLFEDFKADLTNDNELERINALSGSEKEKFIDELYDDFRVELIGEIEKSDIISVDFGADDFTTFALDQVMAKLLSEISDDDSERLIGMIASGIFDQYKMYEMDWSRFKELEDRIDREDMATKLRDLLLENGFPEVYEETFKVSVISISVKISTVDVATYAAEALLYAFVNYIYDYSKTIEAIHDINPEAEILLIGECSALDGVVAEFGDFSIDLTAIGQVVAFAMNVQALVHAMTMPNTTYVNIDDARKGAYPLTFEELITIDPDNFSFQDVDWENFKLCNTEKFYLPESANGYVADQLYAAINFVCYHEYDDCLDTDCEICNEIRIAPGHTFGEWTVIKPASANEAGEKQRVCTVCGKRETAEIEKLATGNGDDPLDTGLDEEATTPSGDEDKQDKQDEENGQNDKASVGAVIGISAGAVAILLCVGSIGYWLAVKKKKIK